MSTLSITCLCGAVRREVIPALPNNQQPEAIEFCHCFGCRHSTGQLFASYYKLHGNELQTSLSDAALTKYTTTTEVGTRSVDLYFCSKCGCHVFRSITNNDSRTVEVATGTIISEDGAISDRTEGLKFGPHGHTQSTTDGGASIWMPFVQDSSIQATSPHAMGNIKQLPLVQEAAKGTTTAACLCGQLQFRITPPNEDSITPHSGYPDMIIPFYSNNSDIKNPNDEKWWLRQNNTKYMAGLCACKSCRLGSGFELQSWAFVPKLNIEYRLSNHESGTSAAATWHPLNFDSLREAGVLRSYNSSGGVFREFCSTCGATAFWHDIWRPDLVDVSVGLLSSAQGARAESILEWWTLRVSFAEDATLDRSGYCAKRANYLVGEVEKCLALYNSQK